MPANGFVPRGWRNTRGVSCPNQLCRLKSLFLLLQSEWCSIMRKWDFWFFTFYILSFIRQMSNYLTIPVSSKHKFMCTVVMWLGIYLKKKNRSFWAISFPLLLWNLEILCEHKICGMESKGHDLFDVLFNMILRESSSTLTKWHQLDDIYKWLFIFFEFLWLFWIMKFKLWRERKK